MPPEVEFDRQKFEDLLSAHTVKIVGQVELHESLVDLGVPAADAPLEKWEQFLKQLQMAIENQDALLRYRQLQAEVEKLIEEHKKRWKSLHEEDWNVLIAYLQGTKLFYDCLQLAYTPEREGFEERILAPPP